MDNRKIVILAVTKNAFIQVLLRERTRMAKRKETVTRVIDGDTFRTSSRKHSVRLANVDAPEKGTKGGSKATQKLKSLIQGKKVEVNTVARDTYGRAVANVKVGRTSVNKAVSKRTKK
jgi:endonuclease YncB( thermonuclease family)